MNSKEYQVRVLETESKPETLNLSVIGLDLTMIMMMSMGEVANKIKRAAFYGKPLEKDALLGELTQIYETVQMLGNVVHNDALQDDAKALALFTNEEGETPDFLKTMDIQRVNLRLFHGVVGEVSEAGEKVEALRNQLMTGDFDLVNYAEEIGDFEWYSQIQKDELRVLAQAEQDLMASSGAAYDLFDASEEAIRARNIAKLEARNKGRSFNAKATINRDHDAERTILESSIENLRAGNVVKAEFGSDGNLHKSLDDTLPSTADYCSDNPSPSCY